MSVKWVPQGYPIVAVWLTVVPGARDGYDEPEGVWSVKDHAGMSDEQLSKRIASDYVAFWQIDTAAADPGEIALPVTVNATLLGPESQVCCGVPEDRARLIAEARDRMISRRDYALARCQAMGWTPTGWPAPPTEQEIQRRRGYASVRG